MKTCSNCGASADDNAVFCTKCGSKFENNAADTAKNSEAAGQPSGGAANYQNGTPNYQSGAPNYQNGASNYQNDPVYAIDPYDHTAEFTEKDISENKVIAMLVYLMGTVGIIIALLGSQSSPYAAFHVRQALKFSVISILMGIITILLFWTIIVPIAAVIAYLVLFVVRITCFFSICKGRAKEPYIIRSFGFLR